MHARLFACRTLCIFLLAGCQSQSRDEAQRPRRSHAPTSSVDAATADGAPGMDVAVAEPHLEPLADAGRMPTRETPGEQPMPMRETPRPSSEPASDAAADDAGSVPDAAAADSGVTDASATDASVTDAGMTDAGDVDPPSRADGCPDGAPLPVDRVRIRPGPGQGALLVGAKLQGSNTGPTTDFVDLATIAQPPPDDTFSDWRFANADLYRYVRYYAPPGSQGRIAELEFYSDATRLGGAGFGTASPAGESFLLALDGDPATTFAPAARGGGYVGLDIAEDHVAAAVRFTPDGTNSALPLTVELSSSTADAVIRYTTDGSEPSATNGAVYAAPIAIDRGRTELTVLASARCAFDSAITRATYTVGQTTPASGGLKSYHIGNSLTDTINRWLEPIADSTGVDHEYARWTIPGAPIKWLAEHQGEGFEDPEGASHFDTFVQTFAPIDHLSLQPYSDPDFESQGGAAVGLLTTALAYNPNIQFWIYAQWPGRTEWMTEAFANGGGTVYPDWQVETKPTTWEAATQNYALYFEAFRDYVDSRVGGKPFLIVPGGVALVELKRQMEAGLIPGMTGDFFTAMFEDEAHLNVPAQYLVSLVFYACLYRQTPEGRVTSSGTGLTPEQALALQRIAWSVASGYAGSGISPPSAAATP